MSESYDLSTNSSILSIPASEASLLFPIFELYLLKSYLEWYRCGVYFSLEPLDSSSKLIWEFG
jgi:hypothetical protein